MTLFIKNTVLLDVKHVYDVYEDPASRFLIVQSSISGKAITIANVYVSNDS